MNKQLLLFVGTGDEFQTQLTAGLEELGYDVISALQASEARELFTTISFGAIFVEGLLRDGGGIELIEELRGFGYQNDVFFISPLACFTKDYNTSQKLTQELKVKKIFDKSVQVERILRESNALLQRTFQKQKNSTSEQVVQKSKQIQSPHPVMSPSSTELTSIYQELFSDT